MEEKKLQIQLGDTIQLQQVASDNNERYTVEVIGFLAGRSLVVTTPLVAGKVMLVREGQRFNVRVLHGSRIHGFLASVLHSYSSPYPHLHLSYPRDFESIVVRNAPRVETDIICAARNAKLPDLEENYRAAHIIDLSSSGARMTSRRLLGEPGEGLVVHLSVQICDMEEMLVLLAEVRSLDKRLDPEGRQLFRYGLEFRALTRFQKVLLHAHVLEQTGYE